MSSINAIASAIYSTLTAGTALTAMLSSATAVFRNQAPDNFAFDYVVFNLQAGGPENFTANHEVNNLWSVKCYTQTSPARAGAIDAAVDALLHGKTLAVTGYSNFYTAREQDLELVENPRNPIYMAGGIYRIRLCS